MNGQLLLVHPRVDSPRGDLVIDFSPYRPDRLVGVVHPALPTPVTRAHGAVWTACATGPTDAMGATCAIVATGAAEGTCTIDGVGKP